MAINYEQPLNNQFTYKGLHGSLFEQAAILQNAADQDAPEHLAGWREWVVGSPSLAIEARNAILREALKILEKKS